jgi:AcrR family transcriptional regulator
VGTVYNHFEDRQAILADLLEVRRKELARRLDKALSDGEQQPFEGQLRRFAQEVFEHFENHRQFCAIMLESDHARMTQPSPAMRELRTRAETLIHRGVKGGSLRYGREKLLPGFLWASIKSVLLADLREPGLLPVSDRAEAAVDFFLNGARP